MKQLHIVRETQSDVLSSSSEKVQQEEEQEESRSM